MWIVITLILLLVLTWVIFRKRNIEGTMHKRRMIKNPDQGYWYWRSDTGGSQEYQKNGIYIRQSISPPRPIGSCSDSQPCPSQLEDTACIDGECIPYANAEIYNNPCCSLDKLTDACEDWIAKDGLEWLWTFCEQNVHNPICQKISKEKIVDAKDQLCKLFRSVCGGPVADQIPSKYSDHCHLVPSPVPLMMDPEPFDAIRELFLNCPYLYSKFQAKIRVGNLRSGSRGWGFWNTTMIPKDMAMAWFMQQDGVCTMPNNPWCPIGQEYAMNGMYAMIVMPGKNPVMVKLPDLDEEWHNYEIDWTEDHVRFYIDRKLVHEEKTVIPSTRMAFHCWVDNAVFAPGHVVQKMVSVRSQDIKDLKIWL